MIEVPFRKLKKMLAAKNFGFFTFQLSIVVLILSLYIEEVEIATRNNRNDINIAR